MGWYPGRGRIFFFSPKRPDGLWGPPTLICKGCRGSFLGTEQLRFEVNLRVVSRLRMSAATRAPRHPPPQYTFMTRKRKTLPLALISQSERCDINHTVRTTMHDMSEYSRAEQTFVHFDTDLCIHWYQRVFQIKLVVTLLILHNEPFDFTLIRKLLFQVKRALRIYRVSQEECVRIREDVPYVKVYRYNPKHLCPKLNGYGDKGQGKVWSSCGSTYCTWFAWRNTHTLRMVRPCLQPAQARSSLRLHM